MDSQKVSIEKTAQPQTPRPLRSRRTHAFVYGFAAGRMLTGEARFVSVINNSDSLFLYQRRGFRRIIREGSLERFFLGRGGWYLKGLCLSQNPRRSGLLAEIRKAIVLPRPASNYAWTVDA